jgi:hypothetical protein
MSKIIFKEVWYRFNADDGSGLWAFYDSGTLEILDNHIRFTGKKGTVDVIDIHYIAYGRQGFDSYNNWVKIFYKNGEIALFADGTCFGWRGALGGTRKLLKAIKENVKITNEV